MFIKENVENRNIAHGYLRDKLIKEIKESLIIIEKEPCKEEKLRKELLEKIRRGEFKEIPA